MKIYTKTGDGGETSLVGGTRVSKGDARIEAYGCVDELNSSLGVVRSLKPSPALEGILAEVQSDLFVLGADLAAPRDQSSPSVPRIVDKDAEGLEGHIDKLEQSLEPLNAFILPGGTPLAAHLHQARTICRRAERLVVRLSKDRDLGTAVVVYLNRLSDLLFVMARFANREAAVHEVRWKGSRESKG